MLELLKKRRSIRKYTGKEIEKEKILKLVQSALLSPSSRGLKPWEFVVVEDKLLIEKLSFSKPGASFLKYAPLAIVILGNPELSDVWIEDTSISSTLIQLTAESLGLGSCWIQIRGRKYNEEKTSENYIREVLDIPSNLTVLCIISIGYPDETKAPYTEEELNYEKVYLNKYRTKYIVK